MRLKRGIVLFHGRFRSPLPARRCKKGGCFDDSYAHSGLQCAGDGIIPKTEKACLQLGKEFLNGDRGLPGDLDHFQIDGHLLIIDDDIGIP